MVLHLVRFSAVLVLFCCGFLHAQEATPEPISTERPTAGYSPDVIGGGSLQVENGLGASVQGGHSLVDLPESLIRLGFFGRGEVRFQSSNFVYAWSPKAGTARLDSEDLGISGKLLLGRANSFMPRSGVLSLSVPSGGPSVTSGSYDPGVALIWTQSLAHGYSFNEVGIATLTTLDGARRPVWAPSLLGGKAVSSQFSLFAEIAPCVLQDRSVTWYYDGGFALLPNRNRQIDVRVGHLIDSTGSHLLVAVGVSVRRETFLPGLMHR